MLKARAPRPPKYGTKVVVALIFCWVAPGTTCTHHRARRPAAAAQRAAAALALPGPSTRTSHTRWAIDVADGLNVDLQPAVVAADARHVSSVVVQMHDDGA